MDARRLLSGFQKLGRLPELHAARMATSEWVSLAAAYAGVRSAVYPRTVALRDGRHVRLEDFFDLTTFWHVFFSSTYQVSASDLRIVDAGANIGLFTVYAAAAAPRAEIASVEPFPKTFDRLAGAVSLNHLTDRVKLFRAALGGTNGTARMDGQASVASQFRSLQPTGDLTVETLTLESLLTKCGWETADLLKIDIEGAEYEALLNAPPAVLGRIGRIVLEYHPRPGEPGYTPEALFAHAEKGGFTVARNRPDGGGYGIAHLVRRPTAPRP